MAEMILKCLWLSKPTNKIKKKYFCYTFFNAFISEQGWQDWGYCFLMNVLVYCASGCLWLCHQSRLADLRTESVYKIWSTPPRPASQHIHVRHLRRQPEGKYFSLWPYQCPFHYSQQWIYLKSWFSKWVRVPLVYCLNRYKAHYDVRVREAFY